MLCINYAPLADFNLAVSRRVLTLVRAANEPTFGARLISRAFDFVRMTSLTTKYRQRFMLVIECWWQTIMSNVRDDLPPLRRFTWGIGRSAMPFAIHCSR